MHDLSQERNNRLGHSYDKRVLKYLREMIRVCRLHNRRDLVFIYRDAWEFASQRIYGQLPPRAESQYSYQPSNPPVPDPAPGPRPELKQQPLRKIVNRFTRPYRTWELTYESLECGHILLAPAGYSAKVERRRCIECARAAMPQKKPAASASAFAQKKEVSA